MGDTGLINTHSLIAKTPFPGKTRVPRVRP